MAYKKLIARVAALLKDADGEVDKVTFDAARASFCEALDNDMNTSLAVTALYDVFKLNANNATKLALVEEFDKVLTLNLVKAAKTEEEKADAGVDAALVAEIEAQIAARAEAKKNKNYAEADRIRNDLAARGITLIDTKDGTQFKIG